MDAMFSYSFVGVGRVCTYCHALCLCLGNKDFFLEPFWKPGTTFDNMQCLQLTFYRFLLIKNHFFWEILAGKIFALWILRHHLLLTIIAPWYLQRIDFNTSYENQDLGMPKCLNKVDCYLHIFYSYFPVYFKSSLDYL